MEVVVTCSLYDRVMTSFLVTGCEVYVWYTHSMERQHWEYRRFRKSQSNFHLRRPADTRFPRIPEQWAYKSGSTGTASFFTWVLSPTRSDPLEHCCNTSTSSRPSRKSSRRRHHTTCLDDRSTDSIPQRDVGRSAGVSHVAVSQYVARCLASPTVRRTASPPRGRDGKQRDRCGSVVLHYNFVLCPSSLEMQ
jgi:hypothetical protein